ncbi:hypothetical protein C2845_PM03G20700 [Panicum miliaceum]|uniref:65-kDa microtubule-associated protein 3-like n=1 Tax=Panicum miliaceum TaxID=4540 RepID=A0A3L6T9M4_PANMI|nr:hypothetical protein C2845_PM03G20700 [Panicum miliaceum]
MRQKKVERQDQFVDVMDQIKKVASDLSLRELEELMKELQSLQKEKVLGIDFKQTVCEVHPSLGEADGSKNLSNSTIERLASAVNGLREMKVQRMQKLQDLASSMLELWNFMDTPLEEQQVFQNVTSNIAASEHEITEPNSLSIDYLSYVESKVLRLEQLKASKMKGLVFKKETELEENRRRAHLIGEEGYAAEFSTEAIEAGAVDPALVLEQIESHIATVREEAFSRKDILEKVERWLNACEEEAWLEDYNKDDTRYNAGRGAHLTLKRMEKARILANKIPGMVDVLTTKIHAWEKEREKEFTYDGDQKKIQDQIKAEQEALYGSKPSSSKPPSTKKAPRNSMGGANRWLSLGGATMQAPKTDILHSKTARAAKKTEDLGKPI